MSPDPMARFLSLYEEAKEVYPDIYNAMTLSTVGPDCRPSSRVVLLKGVDERGFVFYTNLESRKGRELAQNRYAALCFWWPSLEVQVRVEGPVHEVPPEEADAYFATRPRGSQLGAWASKQSEVLSNRDILELRAAELAHQYEGQIIPRPPHWSGLRVVPERLEFWKNRMDRLHEREVYVRASPDAPWTMEWLYP